MDYKYFREIEVPILEKNDNIKLNSEKKSYRQPQLREIGKLNQVTKGSGSDFSGDSAFPFFVNS